MRQLTQPPGTLGSGATEVYSDHHALATAEHAVAVYEHPADYGLLAMQAGYLGGTVVEAGSAQCGIAWHHDTIVIAARGSSERWDWYADLLSVIRLGWDGYLPDGVRVGWGFRRQAERLVPKLEEHLAYLLPSYPRARIVVTGHSLGAALVPLLMVWLRRMAADKSPVAYMHEAPRVGGARWAEHYRRTVGPTYSVVNVVRGEVDLVTRVPKRSWGFRHVGKRVVITEDGHLRGWSEWMEWRAANPVGAIAAWRIITRTATAIRAHFGSALLRALRARVARAEDGIVT